MLETKIDQYMVRIDIVKAPFEIYGRPVHFYEVNVYENDTIIYRGLQTPSAHRISEEFHRVLSLVQEEWNES